MENLRECPFCENTNIKLSFIDNALVWELLCLVCGITYTHVDKERIIKFWNSRPKENALESKIIMLREDIEILRTSYSNIESENNTLKVDLNLLKKNLQTTTASYNIIENNYNVLQKSFDKYIKLAKQDKDGLQTKIKDEQATHQYYYEITQAKLNKLEKDIQIKENSYKDIQDKCNSLQKSLDEHDEVTKQRINALQHLGIGGGARSACGPGNDEAERQLLHGSALQAGGAGYTVTTPETTGADSGTREGGDYLSAWPRPPLTAHGPCDACPFPCVRSSSRPAGIRGRHEP